MMSLYQNHQESIATKKFSKFFPGKLRNMLDSVQGLGLAHGISWVSDGCAFAIHDPNVYMTEIAPRFFRKQTHLRSFHRQLSIWGFTRLETGAGGRGVWFHKNFIRTKPELITRIKRVPVKHATQPKTTEAELSSNPTMDYTNYRLNDKVAKAIGASNNKMPFTTDGILSKKQGKRPSLPLRKRSGSAEEGDDSKPSPTTAAAAHNAAAAGMMNASMMNAGMMNSLDGQTPLQRLYASQEASAPTHLPGSPSGSRLPPFILTSYQPSGGSMAASSRFPSQGYASGSFLSRANVLPPSAPTSAHMEDEIVARQLAALARPNPTDAIAAASASRSSLVSNDAALMARAMVMESERRRHHSVMMQAQAQAAQAQAAQAQAAQAAQAQAMSMGMPPHPSSMGSDTDILAAIQQRQRFLSRLESEFKAKMARGGGGGM